MSTNIFVNQTIDFDMWDGYPTGSSQGGPYTITLKGTVAWSNRDAFAFAIAPVGTVNGGWGVGLVANPKFRVVGFQWEPYGRLQTADSQGLNTFPFALFTVTCLPPMGQTLELTQPFQNADPVANLIHRWSIGGQFLTIPSKSLVWASDNSAVGAAVSAGIFIPTIEHSITWPRLLQPPYAAVRAACGTINNAAVTFSTGVIATGQLLSLGAESERVSLSDGTIATNLTYKFSERPLYSSDGTALTWNWFKRDDTASNNFIKDGWDQLQVKSTGNNMLRSTNFANLFPPGTY